MSSFQDETEYSSFFRIYTKLAMLADLRFFVFLFKFYFLVAILTYQFFEYIIIN